MTLIVDRMAERADGPALHALVIGVGHYPHMDPPGLTSAADSALAFARWIAEHHQNPDCPVGTIELLVSGAAPASFDKHVVASATMANLKAAVADWFARADSHEKNIALFYFAGHGIERGLKTGLLTQDYPSLAHAPLDPAEAAVDFTEFAGGMERCLARRQVYALDACRNWPPWLAGVGAVGVSLVSRDIETRPSAVARDWPVLRAAAAEQEAWGPPEGVSYFTGALLRALDGGAADDRLSPDASYEVRTDAIISSIQHLAQQGFVDGSWQLQQPRLSGESAGFVFHRPDPVLVPMRVGCEDVAENAAAVFRILCDGGTILTRDVPAPDDWLLSLSPDAVEVQADFENGAPRATRTRVTPPCRQVRL